LQLPSYTDTTGVSGVGYEYAVSTHDIWGNHSVLSPLSRIAGESISEGLEPPLSINLRNLTRGIEVSWPVSLTEKGGEYAVYRKVGEQRGFVKIGNTPVNRFYVDAAVNADTVYEYYVVRVSGNNEGTPSSTHIIRR